MFDLVIAGTVFVTNKCLSFQFDSIQIHFVHSLAEKSSQEAWYVVGRIWMLFSRFWAFSYVELDL